MPLYVYTRLVFSWGFSVRPPGLSAGGPSLPLPPPSTLVGAIAAGVARILGWPEAELLAVSTGRRGASRLAITSSTWRLARHLLAAGARLRGPVAQAQDLVKYSTLPYQSPGNIADPSQWFGAQNFGLALAPGIELDAVVVLDDEVEDEGVTREVLEAAATAIQRVGSRESIVHVIEYSVGDAREAGGGETALYAPLASVDVESLDPDRYWVVEAWNPRCPEAYMRTPPTRLEPLRLAAPMRPGAAPGVYRSLAGRLPLRREARSYIGDWSRELGVIASLPDCGGGG
jgi:CRISPR-associated Cas5-like protein